MVANSCFDEKERGQSIIEFLLMLPLFIGMVISLVKVSSAIQSSIVNQQYARLHALWLTFNSPYYPELRFTEGKDNHFFDQGINQMLIFVGEEAGQTLEQQGGGGGNLKPSAPTQNIAKGANARPASSNNTNSRLRTKVRILNSVSLCTNDNNVKVGGRSVKASQMPNGGFDFNFCGYPLVERGIE